MRDEIDGFFDSPMREIADLYDLAERVSGYAGLATVFMTANDLDGPAYEDAVRALRSGLWDVAEDLRRIHQVLLKAEQEKRLMEEASAERE